MYWPDGVLVLFGHLSAGLSRALCEKEGRSIQLTQHQSADTECASGSSEARALVGPNSLLAESRACTLSPMIVSRAVAVSLGLTAALLTLGCDSPKSKETDSQEKIQEASPAAQPAPTNEAAQDPVAEAKLTFTQRCVVCHGSTGAGDGPGAAALEPKPRAFSDPAWQDGVTDEHIKTIIVSGGTAAGKSPLMPGNPDLKAKPEVVTELVKLIRGFKK